MDHRNILIVIFLQQLQMCNLATINGVKSFLQRTPIDNITGPLNDRVYHTLLDIMANSGDYMILPAANMFLMTLTKGKDKKAEDFKYANVLQNKEYVEKLLNWCNKINEEYFDFEEAEGDEDLSKYIPADKWFYHFDQLKRLLEERLRVLSR
jgi:hypothetical protein